MHICSCIQYWPGSTWSNCTDLDQCITTNSYCYWECNVVYFSECLKCELYNVYKRSIDVFRRCVVPMVSTVVHMATRVMWLILRVFMSLVSYLGQWNSPQCHATQKWRPSMLSRKCVTVCPIRSVVSLNMETAAVHLKTYADYMCLCLSSSLKLWSCCQHLLFFCYNLLFLYRQEASYIPVVHPAVRLSIVHCKCSNTFLALHFT